MNEMAKDLNLLPLVTGKTYRLLVSEMIKDGYHVFIGRDRGILRMDQSPFKPGDIVQGIYTGIDKMKTHTFRPIKGSKIEAALISMEVNTGYVLAMVGGRDFEKSPYNRAIFAKVQPGSAFKPFIYLTALKKGYEPDSIILDEPRTYSMGGGRTWTPKNYDGQYSGPITLKDAIAYSKNAATVRLLEEVGLDALRQTIEELGLDISLQNNLSVALGTANTTLLDLVKGFATFANDGYRVRPIFVRRVMDGSGDLLEETGVEKVSVIPEEIARKMNLLLKGPVEYGTAKGAARLGYPVAGKTGTTSNYCDALFIGYSPYIATGVWAGFDSRASLGRNESGAKVCLPIWMSFMGSALRRYPPDDFAPPYESNMYPWPGILYPY
jgi:penicillin-binding protein 1A